MGNDNCCIREKKDKRPIEHLATPQNISSKEIILMRSIDLPKKIKSDDNLRRVSDVSNCGGGCAANSTNASILQSDASFNMNSMAVDTPITSQRAELDNHTLTFEHQVRKYCLLTFIFIMAQNQNSKKVNSITEEQSQQDIQQNTNQESKSNQEELLVEDQQFEETVLECQETGQPTQRNQEANRNRVEKDKQSINQQIAELHDLSVDSDHQITASAFAAARGSLNHSEGNVIQHIVDVLETTESQQQHTEEAGHSSQNGNTHLENSQLNNLKKSSTFSDKNSHQMSEEELKKSNRQKLMKQMTTGYLTWGIYSPSARSSLGLGRLSNSGHFSGNPNSQSPNTSDKARKTADSRLTSSLYGKLNFDAPTRETTETTKVEEVDDFPASITVPSDIVFN